LTIAGLTYTVIQGAGVGECFNVLSPTSNSLPAGGGSGTINVTSGAQCAWQAVSNVNWVTFTSSGMGIGNGSVSYTVAANSTGTTRKGRITVGNQVFTIKQK
jgi:hypothetical protein